MENPNFDKAPRRILTSKNKEIFLNQVKTDIRIISQNPDLIDTDETLQTIADLIEELTEEEIQNPENIKSLLLENNLLEGTQNEVIININNSNFDIYLDSQNAKLTIKEKTPESNESLGMFMTKSGETMLGDKLVNIRIIHTPRRGKEAETTLERTKELIANISTHQLQNINLLKEYLEANNPTSPENKGELVQVLSEKLKVHFESGTVTIDQVEVSNPEKETTKIIQTKQEGIIDKIKRLFS